MQEVLRSALKAYGKGEEAPVLPEGLSVEVHDPVSMGGSGEAHKALFGVCNAEQSKAVLGEMLTIEPGESGSYKLGNVHQDSAHEVIVGDAVTTASDTQRDLMLAVIEENADALAQVFNVRPEELVLGLPRCGFRTDREWTPQQRIAIYRDATGMGVEASESQMRNELQLDRPTSPHDAIKGEPVVVAKGGAAVGSTDASQGVKVPDPAAEQESEDDDKPAEQESEDDDKPNDE
jgi:phage gp29-like protein